MTILRLTFILLGLLGLIGPGAIRPAAADDQALIWSRNFGTAGTGASMERIARDNAGNLYAVGTYGGGNLALGDVAPLNRLGSSTNGFVAKLDAGGRVLWARNIGGANAFISSLDVSVDSSGNVVVAGTFSGGSLTDGNVTLDPGTNYAGLVIKYDSTGTRLWSTGLGQVGTDTKVRAVATDSADRMIVVGSFTSGDLASLGLSLQGDTDGFIVRYNADGTLSHTQHIHGPGTNVQPTSIVTTGTTSYVGGYFFGDVTTPLPMNQLATGEATGFMLRLDDSLAVTWRQTVGGAGAGAFANSIAIDGTGNVLLLGAFRSGSMTIPPLARLNMSGNTGFVIKATPDGPTSSTFAWAKAIGGDNTDIYLLDMAVDGAGNAHVTGYFSLADLTTPALTRIGSSSMIWLKLAAADGAIVEAQAIGGTDAGGYGVATDAVGNVFLAGGMTGSLSTPVLPAIGTSDALLLRYGPRYTLQAVKAGTGAGTVTADSGALSCGATCQDIYVNGTIVTLTAAPAAGSAFAGWSGACTGASISIAVTMSVARSCTATFNLIPPPPPPPPTTIDLPITAGSTGQGRIALGAALGNPGPGAVITVTQAGGGALPGWLVFDRATLTLSFTVPMPEDLPFQPGADVRAARAAPPNLVYPPSFLVQAVPLALTVDGRAFSFSMDFHAPRSPTAMTALSYGPTGRSGDGASGKPSLSWDGGQVLFETSANNLFGAVSAETKIGRYHGLSGNRDLLSQTAIPGGGVANAAPGPATAPAVSANGAFGVFAAAGGSVTLNPTSPLKQIYRTSLAYPRVALNEAATPAPEMVSTTDTGVPANAAADRPAISENGAFVAFESAATNLGWNEGGTQVWRKDTTSGAIMLVSSNAAGTAGNGDSRNVSLSWDGRFAAFESTATNLVLGTSGQHVYLKDLTTGAVFVIAPGTTPKLDARATSIVFAASGQIQRYDVATGRITTLASGDQPSISADGRFVAWRTTDSITQIRVHDVFRGVSALVSQTAAGQPGSGNSYDPALSGDGASIAFGAQARDLVNGNPLPGQIHLAGNPLALPGRTAHWYVPSGGNQAWAIERWGDRAYVANLAYRNDGGPGTWIAGLCAFADLGCKGTLNPGPLALATWFPADGTQAVASVNGTANQALQFYPVLGTSTTAMPGLPQSGWWYDPAASGSGVFLQLGTQTAADGAVSHTAHLSLLSQDTVWYAAEGTLASDLSLEGTLYRYAGGAPVGQVTGSPAPSVTAIGQYRLTFAASDLATLRLPDGSNRNLVRFRF